MKVGIDQNRSCFRHGQEVKGQLLLESCKDLAVNRIETSLVCEEFAGVSLGSYSRQMVPQKNYSKVESKIHYSSTKQLFPGPLLGSSGDFKITSGAHNFTFTFRIPKRVSLSSTHADGGNHTVTWKITAKVIFADIKNRNITEDIPITVVAPKMTASRGPNHTSVCHATLHLRSKNLGDRTQLLFKKNSVQRKIPLEVELGVPSSGLQQSPLAMGAQMTLTYPDNEILKVVALTIYLKEKTKYTLNGDKISSIQSMDYRVLVSKQDIILKGGKNSLSEVFDQMKLHYRLAGSLESEMVHRDYSLKFGITICDYKFPNILDTVQVKFPVRLQNPERYTGRKPPVVYEEPLPLYTPRVEGV